MYIVLVTGISGAGKSSVLDMLEDRGFFCVDNLPPPLLRVFCDLLSSQQEIDKVGVGIDVRSGSLEQLIPTVKELREVGYDIDILFLEADNKTLLKRYKETRRVHPLEIRGDMEEAISKERQMVGFLKEWSDYVIDTTNLLNRKLKQEIDLIFAKRDKSNKLFVDIKSFGFKHGILEDADVVFDVRFLPNPYYYENLRPLTGNDDLVYQYVMAFEESQLFVEKVVDLMRFLIPQYINEGKNSLVIGIGCTGGHHRSVTIGRALEEILKTEENCTISLYHRDIHL